MLNTDSMRPIPDCPFEILTDEEAKQPHIGLEEYFTLFILDRNKPTKRQVWFMEKGLVDIRVLPWMRQLAREQGTIPQGLEYLGTVRYTN